MNERFETFTVLIAKINRNIRKIKNYEMAEYNLRSTHISCLYYIYSSESITATELCEKCEEDKASISRAVDYLRKNGYIVTDQQSEKRYKTPLILTELGKNVGKQISDKVSAILKEISTLLTEEEREVFYKCLSVVSESLDEIGSRFGERD